MNWKVALLVSALIILRVTAVSAQCNSTQIDINSASLDEMMGIIHLGGKGIVAQKVINARPFRSLDGLTRVSGIGNKTLADIKQQGIACVSSGNESSQIRNNSSVPATPSDNKITTTQPENKDPSLLTAPANIPDTNSNEQPSGNSQSANTITNPQVINLNVNLKNKSSNSKDYSIKANPAIYGLAGFSILLGLLFAAKKFRTKRYKSEFD